MSELIYTFRRSTYFYNWVMKESYCFEGGKSDIVRVVADTLRGVFELEAILVDLINVDSIVTKLPFCKVTE